MSTHSGKVLSFALTCLVPVAANAAFPPVVTVLEDGLEPVTARSATLDGIAVLTRPTGDIDGDGLGDRIIEIPATDIDPCPGVAIAPSSLGTNIDFTSDGLNTLVRIVDQQVTDDRGRTSCAYNNLRVLSEPRRIGDINGDGLIDFVINVSGIFDNEPRIVFGSTTPGTLIDLDNLTGANGFTMVNAPVIEPVGDLNGDGITDIAYGAGNSSLIGVISGVQSYGAVLDTSSVSDERRLIRQLSLDSVTGFGDIDGDGFDDLVAFPDRIPHIIYGAADLAVESLDDTEARITRLLEECGVRQCSMVPIGDVDGDGRNDLFATQRFEEFNNPPRSILYGRAGGLVARSAIADYPAGESTRLSNIPNFSSISIIGRQHIGSFNESYATASGQRFDLDGDGVDDVIFGASDEYIVLFGLRGERPPLRSVSLTDGLVASRYDLTALISPFTSTVPAEIADLDFDGLDDFLWTTLEPVFAVPGRSRDIDNEDVLGLVVRRAPDELTLAWRAVDSATSYRIEIDNRFVDELDATATRFITTNLTGGAPFEVQVTALDSAGTSLLLQRRRLPAYDFTGEFRAEVYGKDLLELFFNDRCADVVLRDGEALGRPRGTSFVDDTVQPGQTYQYRLLCDIPLGTDVDDALVNGLRYQRVSEAIEVSTPSDPNANPGTDDPSTPINAELAAPSNLRVERYSARDAELFWDRSEVPALRYEVLRDGASVFTGFAQSFFDPRRPAGSGARYEVIALAPDGTRSPASVITLDSVNTDTPATDLSAPENLRVTRYSFKDAELFWDRPDEPGLRYEVFRDGESLSIQFGISYFDTQLTPNASAIYEVVAVRSDNSRSTAATVTLPPSGDGASTTSTPAPENLRASLYSSTAVELFWTRPAAGARVVRTEVARDGESLGSTPGNSFYDDTREPGRVYRYALVAVDSNGGRSAVVDFTAPARTR